MDQTQVINLWGLLPYNRQYGTQSSKSNGKTTDLSIILDPVGKVANKIDKLAYYSVETVTIKNLNYSTLKYK
jgi:hypothetical protein